MYCSLAVVDDFLPVPVLALELVLELDFLRRDQAQGGVIDREVANVRRQAHRGLMS